MATPTEKWKSSGHLTKQNTFLKQGKRFGNRSVLFEDGFSTPASPQHLRVMQLQQDLVWLQERERRAKWRNRQLLQQFEQAQSALEEIMACNTTMRAIRMEYERYLEDSAPRWEQQFKEKTEAAQQEFLQQRMEKHLKLRLEEAEDPVPKLSDDSFRSQGAQKAVAPQACPTPEHRSNKDGYPYPFTQYSWLTHPSSQTSKFSIGGLYPPPLLSSPSSPHPFLVHPFSSSAFPPYPLSSKDPAVLDSSQHGSPWLAGTSLGFNGYNKEPHPELRSSQNGEQNSKRSGGSRSSHLSQELDIKPVRLSSRHSDSSGSSRGPTLSTKGKSGKNRGSIELSSSDINSEESSRTPSVTASVAESQVLKHPTSDKSSFRKTHKSDGFTATSPKSDKNVEERTEKKRSEKLNGENQHSEEESGNSSEGFMREKEGKQRHGEESKSGRGEKLKKDYKKMQNEAAGEEVKQGSGSWEQRNAKEEVPKNLSSEEEKWQKGQKQENRDEDSYRETTTEEEAGMEAEEEDEGEDEDAGMEAEEEEDEGEDEDAGMEAEEEEDEGEDEDAGMEAEEEEDEGEDEDAGKEAEEEDDGEDEDAETAAEQEDEDDEEARTADEEQPKEIDDEKTEESSSQDEDEEEMESSDKKNKEEEPKSEEEVKTDSDDSIISPQNKRNVEKEFHLVFVTPAEDDLLQSSTQMQTIPETATEEEEEDENAAESSDEDDVENVLAPQDRQQKDASHVDLFRVTEDRRKTERHSDSDESDHFYD